MSRLGNGAVPTTVLLIAAGMLLTFCFCCAFFCSSQEPALDPFRGSVWPRNDSRTMVVYDMPGSFWSCFFFIISSPFSSRVFVPSLGGGDCAGCPVPEAVGAEPLGEAVVDELAPFPGAVVLDIEA